VENFPFLQVLAVAVVYMIIGSIWHGPLFGKLWMSLAKVDASTMKSGSVPKAMALGFLNEIVMAGAIAAILQLALPVDLHAALLLGGTCWLGFSFTDAANRTIWEQAPVGLLGIAAGYALVKIFVAVYLFTSVPWFQIV
jgi:hypothetical protein